MSAPPIFCKSSSAGIERTVRGTCLLWCLGLLVCGTLFGQNELTLQDCLGKARLQNVRTQIARHSTLISQLARDEVGKSALPLLRFTAGAIYAPSYESFGYDPIATDEGQLSGRITLEQPLYDGGIRSLRTDQSDLDVERTMVEQKLADRDLAFAVRQLFVELLRAQREVDLAAESIERLRDYLDLVRSLSHGGTASYSDVLTTEVKLSAATISYEKSLESARKTKYELAEVMGGEIDTVWSAAGSLENVVAAVDDSLSLSLPVDSTLALDARIAEYAVKRDLIEIELARHERYPTLSAFGDAGLLTSISNLRLPRGERSSNVGYEAGLSLELPLFNWGASDLRIQQRELEAQTLQLQLSQIRRSFSRETREVNLGIAGGVTRLRMMRSSLKSAVDNFLMSKSRFAGGSALALEVLDAQQLLTDSKLQELEALADLQELFARREFLLSQ